MGPEIHPDRSVLLLVPLPLHLSKRCSYSLFIHLSCTARFQCPLLFYQEAFHLYPPSLVLGRNQPATASFIPVSYWQKPGSFVSVVVGR